LVNSLAPQDRQLLGLLHAACGDLLRDHDWSILQATASMVTASANSIYALPDDFERVVESTGWDRTNNFPMMGNIPPQRHQFWLSSLSVAPSTRKEFRLFVGNNASAIYVHPTPDVDGEVLSFIYIKRNWATDSMGANPTDRIAADTDLTLFKPELLVKELKWRFRSAKGLDSTAFKIECDNFKDLLLSRDIASSGLDMTGPMPLAPFDWLNIKDGNWSL
jgi:hypothetical protein